MCYVIKLFSPKIHQLKSKRSIHVSIKLNSICISIINHLKDTIRSRNPDRRVQARSHQRAGGQRTGSHNGYCFFKHVITSKKLRLQSANCSL
ncbi:MAG: hypothetical protein [Inoviridae sp.]|nr:MAG: hypothetical protein [Inoviridae sp.]